MRMKFHLLIIAALLLPLAPSSAQQAKALTTLRKSVSGELGSSLFTHALAAVEISDAASGTILYSQNESLLLRPASNAKLFTSAAAVLGLPADFSFKTQLAAADSAMHTIICIGGGDPLSDAQDIQKLAEIAYRAGVTRIDTLLLDDSLFENDYFGRGWMWDDESDPFTPYLSAFSVNSNTVTIRVSNPAKNDAELIVSSIPSSRIFRISHRKSSTEEPEFRIERMPRSNEFIIHGRPRRGQIGSEKFSIWQPHKLFADLLVMELQQRGLTSDSVIVMFSPSHSPLRLLGEVETPLAEVLEMVNKESDNLCAEAVLRALSFGTGIEKTGVSAEDGIAAMVSILSKHKLGTDDIALQDGSGISFYNLVTAASIGRVLRTLSSPATYSRYRSSMSIAGIDGTLRNRMPNLSPPASFRGKTGTVRGVSALSGYVQAPGGRLLTVVMLMQNFVGKASPYREVQDRIVKHCLEYSASFTAVKQPR
ncbi:MAG: D-alanyl-D-alanine carboxypeptidase/D-alanyl-D-alanine-endopeptidase [Bacteroidota bacterium]|jgi:D-alanyl-D-alanine carboxypeptidase/D-alanyl-D-alanine-endopeptidase (penicillin-binding protein 4)